MIRSSVQSLALLLSIGGNVMLCRSILLLPVCLLLAVGSAQSGDKKEEKKLEGTWTMVKRAGGAEKKEVDKDVKVTFKGNKIKMTHGDKGDKTEEATFSVDPSKKPATMDLTITKGDKKITLLSIYELDGDNLKVCHFEGEKTTKERPEKLAADKNTVLVTFKRDKK
jgi:uncharacterized protein (TIGR03067 family)